MPTITSKAKKLHNAKTYRVFIIVFFGIIASILMLRQAGNYLVKYDNLQKSDATLILMGSIADRVLQTADIYKQNLSNEILIVNNIQYGSEYLEQYNVHIPNFAELSRQALSQLSIPDSLITIIPGRAASTMEEATITAAWLKNHPQTDTLIIVSSAAHMRRAHLIFRKEFKKHGLQVHLITAPSKYSNFNAQKWYTDRESAKQVFMEYTKLASFLLIEQWQ